MTPDEVRFMKTIQIPTTSNPFIVIINHDVYTYTAGTTVDVPDEVAAVIEDSLKLVPKAIRYISKIGQIAEGSLKEVTKEDLEGISMIYNCAFYSKINLTKVTIPNNITKIGKSAFEWCSGLTSVYLPETPPALEFNNTFSNINSSCTFYCKTQASLDAYKAAANWSTLTGTYAFVVEA